MPLQLRASAACAKIEARLVADQVLADEEIVATVYEALARRSPKSRSRGHQKSDIDLRKAFNSNF
jgi:hypothetical protein